MTHLWHINDIAQFNQQSSWLYPLCVFINVSSFNNLPWLCFVGINALLYCHQSFALLASMTIYPTISPFFIDDNTHTLTYALSIFLSPFGINRKGHPQVRASFIFIFFSCFHQGHYLLFHSINHIPCSPYHHVVLSSFVFMLCLLLLSSCCASFSYHHALLSSCCSCSPFHDASFSFISPFVVKGKGNISWCFHTWPLRKGVIPNFCLRYSNVFLGRYLVRMFAIYSFVSVYSTWCSLPLS